MNLSTYIPFTEANFARIRDALIARANARTYSYQREDLLPFAKPGVSMKMTIGRYMSMRKRMIKVPEKREFPYWLPGKTTAEYCRQYWSLNGMREPIEQYLTMIERPGAHNGDFYIHREGVPPEAIPATQPELETA